MRIGIVCYPTFGGSGAIATELALELARRDHQVHLISYDRPFRMGEPPPGLTYHQVDVSPYPLFRYPPYALALACKITEVARSDRLEVLHAHYAVPHAVSAYLAREVNPDEAFRVAATMHGTDTFLVGAEQAYRCVTRFALNQADGLTVVSDWLKQETDRVFGYVGPLAVIPNFVDTERFQPRSDPANRARYARPDQRIVVHASNFRPVKRTQDVIRIFAGLRAEVPARLILAGDGPEAEGARDLAEELGVAGDVTFLGRHEEIHRLLQAADLFLLPSEYESFGLAALEAMASGVPVIATATGGLPEVVTDQENGYLCAVGDTDCMAALATELLSDPARQAAFGQAARVSVLERFQQGAIVDRYEEFYRGLLDQR